MSEVILNTNPYYDDFDELKNYHQILFRPEMAVQARELTQLQSILRDQIEKFGNHIFQHGSVVIPGNSFADLYVPYVKINPAYSGVDIRTSYFLGQTVVGQTSGVRAIVKVIEPATATDPITFYLSYTQGGNTAGVANGKVVFDQGEDLALLGNETILCSIVNSTGSVGSGSIAYVNKGVYYVNGTFVTTDNQYTIISKYTSTPSCRVVFRINEEIIDHIQDESLLDPAQGVSNYAAPGADRLKKSLTWMNLPLDSVLTDDYFEIMRYENGVLLEHSRYPKYNELEKSLARRSFDESGDFVVNGFRVSVREHKRTPFNNGVYLDGDLLKLVYAVSEGKAYIKGFEVEQLVPKSFVAYKARTDGSGGTPNHIKQDSAAMSITYGQYILVTDIRGAFDTSIRATIELMDIFGGTVIGTAKLLAIDYLTGDGTKPIYKVFLSNINIPSAANTIASVGYIRQLSVATNNAKVVSEYSVQQLSGTFAATDVMYVGSYASRTKEAVIAFYAASEGKIYAYRHTTSPPPVGATVPLPAPTAGEVFICGASGTPATQKGTGTIQKKQSIITSGPNGLVYRLPKNAIKSLKNGSSQYENTYIVHQKLTIANGQTSSNAVTGTILPIEVGNFIAVSASTEYNISSFTLASDSKTIIKSSAAEEDITIYCQVLMQNATPKMKSISGTQTKNIAAGAFPANGIITLNHADVFSIDSVVLNGVDIRNYFTLDVNANDFAYENSLLRLNPSIAKPTEALTITYRYFIHSSGDFFCADSYTGLGVDYLDQIPQYRAQSGDVYSLRDCIDFRTKSSDQNSLVVSNSVFSTALQRYMPRYDSIGLDTAGNVKVFTGTPSDNPKLPVVGEGVYVLNNIYVPPYTDLITDVKNTRVGVTRYRHQDIRGIEERISRLEDYSTLTASETEFIKTEVVDAATGLNRFKTGYMVENFTDPFKIANIVEGFGASIDGDDLALMAKTSRNLIQMEVHPNISFTNPSTYKNHNGIVTLPYTEVEFAFVPRSSRITNINHYLVIAWTGVITMFPPSIRWVERVDLPDVYQVNQVTVNRTVFPEPAPIEQTNNNPNPLNPDLGLTTPELINLSIIWNNMNPNSNWVATPES